MIERRDLPVLRTKEKIESIESESLYIDRGNKIVIELAL